MLEDPAGRGVASSRRRLFVIDGASALRKSVDLVFGVGTPVQRCRNHKLRNVLGHLPQAQHDQARSTLKAAFKLDAKEGTAQLQKYATWLERDWPSAAGSLREGLDEMFTIDRLGLPSELRRCLGTTNLIDNGHSALRDRVRRVKHWQSGSMALRWAAVAFDAVSKGLRRIMGYKHLWMLRRPSTSRPETSHLLTKPGPVNLGLSRGRQGNFPLSLGHHPPRLRPAQAAPVRRGKPAGGEGIPCEGVVGWGGWMHPRFVWQDDGWGAAPRSVPCAGACGGNTGHSTS